MSRSFSFSSLSASFFHFLSSFLSWKEQKGILSNMRVPVRRLLSTWPVTTGFCSLSQTFGNRRHPGGYGLTQLPFDNMGARCEAQILAETGRPFGEEAGHSLTDPWGFG